MDGWKRYLLLTQNDDDAPRLRAALDAEALEHEIVRTASLRDTLAALQACSFSAIFVDAGLGNARLGNVVEALTAEAPNIPVLMISEAADLPVALTAVERGAQDYLLKSSFDDGTLRRRIDFRIDRFRKACRAARRLSDSQKLTARFESLIRDNADAILVLDSGGRVIFANPAAGDLFKRTPASLVGSDLGIPVDTAESAEIVIGHTDGSDTVADMRIMRTYWDGNPAFLATLRDISVRKRTERALVLAKQQAELANEMKSKFLAHMSHELRTPLNSILGFTEIMEKGIYGEIDNPRYCDYLETIRYSGTHLLTLINNLLDLSKIEAGREELQEAPIETAELLHAAAQTEQPTAHEHGLTLTCEVEAPGLQLYADRVKLDQIILNLLSNAIKFTPQGGQVRLSSRVSPTGDYEIVVADTGCGMDEADIPRAMGSFAQIRSPYVRARDRGTGLGLPIARSLAELHGGRLQVTSERGTGTQVTVTLPSKRVIGQKTERLAAVSRTNAGRTSGVPQSARHNENSKEVTELRAGR